MLIHLPGTNKNIKEIYKEELPMPNHPIQGSNMDSVHATMADVNLAVSSTPDSNKAKI